MTDAHDMEMMIYCSGDYVKAINALDPNGKVREFENANDWHLLMAAKEIADKIARLKLITKREGLNLCFKRKDKDGNIEFPEYEKILDKDHKYISDIKLIQYISDFTRNKLKKEPSKFEQVMPLLQSEQEIKYDEKQLLNGHDLTILIFHLLKKKVKVAIPNNKSVSDLESLLYISMERNSLERTDLYKKLQLFSDDNGIGLFR